MNYISLSTVDEIYSCSSSTKIYQNRLEHHNFRIFCLSLKKFEQSLRENAAEDYWKNFLRPLRQYRFKLCVAPLPFNHPVACQPETIKFLERQLKNCKSMYQDFASAADEILNLLVYLSKYDDNPLLNFIATNYPNTSLLLKESYLIPPVEHLLYTTLNLRKITILVPSQLRTNNCHERLVVIGASHWFPDYIFTAPRTHEINIVHYSWIKDKWQPKPVFIASPDNVIKSNFVYLPISNTEKVNIKTTDIVLEDIEPDEIIPPSINWIEVAKKLSKFSPSSYNEETIEARLFLLDGEIAVYLDTNAKALVIDLVEDGESQVKKELVTDIETDMFIILRTNGGGDYIIPLANHILGEKAQNFRELQQLWKTRLKNQVSSSSLHDVSWKLVNLGSKLAKHEQNIRTWMSNRNIKPKDEKDFNAILTFVGLEDRLKEFHEAAEKIYRAHCQAGKHIRQLLLHKVRASNLQELQQIGKMDFELSEADGGSMTAFRVVDINREVIILPYSKIAHPFQLDGEFTND
ncbi:hypothetical protein FACHB389_17710 [Nostoc calcicola FACHB-389]|nr:hypothetical protein [Nostoc calcicola FACHB-3891]OKH33629.1 hypothetical protein FACHB389_17710 [Nostoc calcicola FACHB-389]